MSPSTTVLNLNSLHLALEPIRVALARIAFWYEGRHTRAVELVLTDNERTELQGLAARRSTAQAMALRARTVLACAEGGQIQDVAVKLGARQRTLGKWRRRFAEHRLKVCATRHAAGRASHG